jgi:hypothetical protein
MGITREQWDAFVLSVRREFTLAGIDGDWFVQDDFERRQIRSEVPGRENYFITWDVRDEDVTAANPRTAPLGYLNYYLEERRPRPPTE